MAYQAPAVAVPHSAFHTAVGSQTQSVYRSLDGHHAVSHYTKAVDTPFSSVRKYDTRISNDAIAIAHAPVVAHAPAVATIAQAPIITQAPVVAQAPALTTIAQAPSLSYTSSYAPSYSTSYAPAYSTAYTPAYSTAFTPAYSTAYAPAYATSYSPTYSAAYAPAYSSTYTPTIAKIASVPTNVWRTYSAAPAVAQIGYSSNYGDHYSW